MKRLGTLVAMAFLAGCATNADGPSYSTQPQSPIPAGYVRINVFRDRVLYLAQAPHVVRAQIVIDNRIVGSLLNGAYLTVDLPAGSHRVVAQSGAYYTIRDFTAGPGVGYIEISDWTRMEGARVAAEGALGAMSARDNAIQAGLTGPQLGVVSVAGAVNAITNDPVFGGPERVWDVEFPPSKDALPRLMSLAKTD